MTTVTDERHHFHPWQRLLRSFGALAVGEVAARALGFIAIVLMARRLEPGGFGLVVAGTTMITWFHFVVDSGTEVITLRDSSRDPERFRERVAPILGLRLALSAGAAILFALAALVVTRSAADREVMLLFALVLPMVGLNLRWMVLGIRGAKSVAAGNIVGQLAVTVGVVGLVRDRHDIEIVPLLLAAGELIYAGVVLAAVVRSLGPVRPRILPPAWRATLRAGAPIAAGNLARTVMYSFDVLLIAVVLTRRDAGLYGAAYKPILFLSTMVGLFGVAFLAEYSSPGSNRSRAILTSRTLVWTVLIAVPGAALLSGFAGTALTQVYGSAYADGAVALALLGWTIPLLALTAPYIQVLIAGDRQATVMRHNVAGALLNVAGNVVAVPLAGLPGAACVTIASFLLVFLLNHRSAVRFGLAEPVTAMVSGWHRAPRATLAADTGESKR